VFKIVPDDFVKTGAFYAMEGVYAENAGAIFCQPLSATAPALLYLLHPCSRAIPPKQVRAAIPARGEYYRNWSHHFQ
jgi:hypothetical protein